VPTSQRSSWGLVHCRFGFDRPCRFAFRLRMFQIDTSCVSMRVLGPSLFTARRSFPERREVEPVALSLGN